MQSKHLDGERNLNVFQAKKGQILFQKVADQARTEVRQVGKEVICIFLPSFILLNTCP